MMKLNKKEIEKIVKALELVSSENDEALLDDQFTMKELTYLVNSMKEAKTALIDTRETFAEISLSYDAIRICRDDWREEDCRQYVEQFEGDIKQKGIFSIVKHLMDTVPQKPVVYEQKMVEEYESVL